MSSGFLCWNRSHVYKMYSICANMENGFFLLLRRKGFNFEKLFSNDFLKSLNLPYLIISPQDIKELDGKIDILIFSDLFPNLEKIKKTFTVILQESNVKDISEFGDSNYLFNLRLVYGPFSSQKVKKYGNFFEIGNPRFDNSFKNFLDQKKIKYIKKGLDPKKKNLLYLPSLDNFSTFQLFLKKIIELRSKYNILFKIQHYSIENFSEINKIYKNLKEFSNFNLNFKTGWEDCSKESRLQDIFEIPKELDKEDFSPEKMGEIILNYWRDKKFAEAMKRNIIKLMEISKKNKTDNYNYDGKISENIYEMF